DGFIVTRQQAEHLGLNRRQGLEKYVREYRNGRDLTARPRDVMVIDLFGLNADDVRIRFPEIYQHVKAEVKEKIVINKKGEQEFVGRDWNNRESYRDLWWIFGEPRRELRPALLGLTRYIVTVETMQHRIFQFLDASILPDNRLVVVAIQDAFDLGVLSSRIHVVWTLANGGTLEDRPIYTKSRCFDPFPFPSPGDLSKAKIRAAAEELDEFRKQRQKEHRDLTLTQMYNVLEKLKLSEALDQADEAIKDKGLILILKEHHEKIDRLVAESYGWPDNLTDEEVLERLVALNYRRAAEEKRGHVRWLRPDYQVDRFGKKLDKQAVIEEGAQIPAPLDLEDTAGKKVTFPADAVSQTAAVFSALARSDGAMTVAEIAADYRKTKNLEKAISDVLASLARLGHVATKDGRKFEIKRVA
ncbi:MAG: hypothetical protein K8F25_15930, partial [Fimbriimonadaceae bacterium]|nr:hypothetical protein [Alphaproteobacteria bacterium]